MNLPMQTPEVELSPESQELDNEYEEDIKYVLERYNKWKRNNSYRWESNAWDDADYRRHDIFLKDIKDIKAKKDKLRFDEYERSQSELS